MTQDDRLIELETRLAHQDQALLELSAEVYQQQKQIAALEERCRSLLEHIQRITTHDPPADPTDEVPPHY